MGNRGLARETATASRRQLARTTGGGRRRHAEFARRRSPRGRVRECARVLSPVDAAANRPAEIGAARPNCTGHASRDDRIRYNYCNCALHIRVLRCRLQEGGLRRNSVVFVRGHDIFGHFTCLLLFSVYATPRVLAIVATISGHFSHADLLRARVSSRCPVTPDSPPRDGSSARGSFLFLLVLGYGLAVGVFDI